MRSFLPLLASAVLLLPGCFTVAGVVVGSAATRSSEGSTQDEDTEQDAAAAGGVIGLVLDAVVIGMLVTSAGPVLEPDGGSL